MVIREGNFAVQRAAVILKNLHASLHQIVVQQASANLDDGYIGLALHDKLHPHAAPGGAAHRVQQPIAGEEIGVGDNHLPTRVGQHFQVVTLNIIPMIEIIPPDEQRLRFSGMLVNLRLMATSPPVTASAFAGGQVLLHKLRNIQHHRPLHLHGVVLLSLRAVAGHMLCGVVNPADKRGGFIHDDNFTVHTAKQVGAHPQQARTRVVVAKDHSRRAELVNEAIAQIRGAVAVEQHLNLDATARGFQQHRMELPAHVILEPDEGFKGNLPLRAVDGAKQRRIVAIAVLQKLDPVSILPAAFHR